ncbi:hypothetical protein [Engelhardtia mirabilis]
MTGQGLLVAAALGLFGLEPAVAAEGGAEAGSTAPAVERMEERRVEVRVTDSIAESVYLNAGRNDGLRVGDTVRLSPAGAAPVEAEIEMVSASSCRARVLAPGEPPPRDTLGEVFVPGERFSAEPQAKVVDPRAGTHSDGDAPPLQPIVQAVPHPPWAATEGEGTRDPAAPLLAQPEGSKPAEREPMVSGRLRLRAVTATSDGTDVDSSRLVFGADLTATNPFGQGGELTLDAETLWRAYSADVEDDSDLIGRVDELAYSIGGDRERPTSLTVGRFSQRGLSRLGRLDGVELSHRDGGDRRWGASIGLIPDLNTSATPFEADEAQVAVSVDQPLGDRSLGSVTLGLQKTWFQGSSDRNLIVVGLDARPAGWMIRGGALIDYYASSTASTPAGFDLTEYYLNVDRPLGQSVGLGVFATRFSLADLKKNELYGDPQLVLGQGPVDRFGGRVWWRATSHWRLEAGVQRFQDSEDTGGGYTLRANGNNLDAWHTGLSISARTNETRYNDQIGVGLDAHWPVFERSNLSAGYSFLRFEPTGLQAALETHDQHSVRMGFDTRIGDDWSLSANVDRVFDTDTDAMVVGLTASLRF